MVAPIEGDKKNNIRYKHYSDDVDVILLCFTSFYGLLPEIKTHKSVLVQMNCQETRRSGKTGCFGKKEVLKIQSRRV